MHEKIKQILNLAVRAPSGDNTQPWRFVLRGDELYIYNIPDVDNYIYNYNQRGSYVANGALIENILIISPSFGLKGNLNKFPAKGKINLLAIIQFEETDIYQDPLLPYIEKRVTNRKPYEREKPLGLEHKLQISDAVKSFSDGKIIFIEDSDKKKEIAKQVSVNEIILLENKSLHQEMFPNICWTEEEEREKKSGLYLKTIELAPPQEVVFKLLRHWPVSHFLSSLGFAKFIAKENAKVYSSASAIGVIVTDDQDKSFIDVGRMLQKVWLTATKLGLSLQPITAIPYLAKQVSAGNKKLFSKKHVQMITNAHQKLCELFEVDNKNLAMIFRVGFGSDPSAFCSRKEPKILIEE